MREGRSGQTGAHPVDRTSTRSEEIKETGRTRATKGAILLLELTIARSRASGLTDEETKECILGGLEEAKRRSFVSRSVVTIVPVSGSSLGAGVPRTPSRLRRRGAAGRANGVETATYHGRRSSGSRPGSRDEPQREATHSGRDWLLAGDHGAVARQQERIARLALGWTEESSRG